MRHLSLWYRSRRPSRDPRRAPGAGVASRCGLLLVALAVVWGCGSSAASPSGASGFPASSGSASAGGPGPGGSGSSGGGSGSSPRASASGGAPPATPGASAASGSVAMVPIVAFWSTERSISRAEVANLVAGHGSRQVAVSAADVAPLGAALGVPTAGVTAASPAAVRAAAKSGALGIVRAEDVTADVRALAVDGVRLFGAQRTKDLAAWPLLVTSTGPASTFREQAIWTVAAGGDVMLDKAVYAQAVVKGKGADFPWNGGTAAIDGRTCCGWGGPQLVTGHRTGNAGALRTLLGHADVALANLEAPTPDDFVYHKTGFRFTADPALLSGLKNAGIDAVSLANNHLGNGGTQGVLDTIRHLDALGIEHAGAGADQPAARKPAWLEAAGLRIAFLAYNDIDPPSYFASAGHPGSAQFSIAHIAADIKAARASGADVVIVMPHWGAEYTADVWPVQRTWARQIVAAGADAIIASHSHWTGPLETIDGVPVFYSLGDFVFDWTHDERTQEGVVVDLTFAGSRVVQIDLHPTLILDGAQPNLLDPAGDGRVVLDNMRKASQALGR